MAIEANAGVLTGTVVQLQPLAVAHLEDLKAASADGNLGELWFTSVARPENMRDYLESAMQQREAGDQIPYAVVERASHRAVGCTRYCNIDYANNRLEIGYTWYAKSVQRTAVNTETKLLLLSQAFENWQVIAVEFRTHRANTRSRRAIARLGAQQDGILRSHQVLPDGSLRDTVVFSITAAQWPAVKAELEEKLRR